MQFDFPKPVKRGGYFYRKSALPDTSAKMSDYLYLEDMTEEERVRYADDIRELNEQSAACQSAYEAEWGSGEQAVLLAIARETWEELGVV